MGGRKQHLCLKNQKSIANLHKHKKMLIETNVIHVFGFIITKNAKF